MATADEQRHAEMVDDHEQRIRKLERALADKLEAQDIETMISERFPQMVPSGKKK
jgi:hypothetical protein